MSEETPQVDDPIPGSAEPNPTPEENPIDFQKVEEELESTKKIAEGLLSKALVMMRELKHLSKSRLVETFQDSYRTKVDPEKILEVLRDLLLEKIQDAEKFLRELAKFVLVSVADAKILNFEECPMLSEVWSGDIYNVRELKGLEAFKKDLSEQLFRLTEALVIKEAHQKIMADRATRPSTSETKSNAARRNPGSRDPARKRIPVPSKK